MGATKRKSPYKNTMRNIKIALFLGFFSPLVLGHILRTVFEIYPTIPANVFEGFIQITSILFGFTILAIFYYFGKLDDHERDYLRSFSDAMLTVKRMGEEADALYKNNKLTEEQKKEVKKEVDGMHARLEKQKEAIEKGREEMVETTDDLRQVVKEWGKIIIMMFAVSLAYSMAGLLIPVIGMESSGLTYLFAIIFSVVASMYIFFNLWNVIQNMSERYSKIQVSIENVSFHTLR